MLHAITLRRELTGNSCEIVFFFNDAQGSTVAAVSEQGDLCWSEQYTPYGDKTINDDLVDVLDGILKSGNQTSKPNRFGGKDIFDNNTGRGVGFGSDGNMKGFLEP